MCVTVPLYLLDGVSMCAHHCVCVPGLPPPAFLCNFVPQEINILLFILFSGHLEVELKQ